MLRVAIPNSRYELLVCDKDWKLVAPANEWYRLRKGVGSPRTRETYLAMLLPFLGYLAEQSWRWDAEPHRIREYTRRFLVDSGCAIQRSRLDGWTVKAGSRSAYSPNALALFIAAARDFYTVLIEGEVDPVTGEVHRYYPHDNPMYSEQLLRWKREHLRALANAGVPDRAGIRGETWRESASKPVAFFRIRRDPWNPPVAREAPAVRRLILQAFGDMIQHAELREKVILRLLLETGARLSEVLQMSAGGYRRGRSMLVGVSALLRDKGSLGIENKPGASCPRPKRCSSGTSAASGRATIRMVDRSWRSWRTTRRSSFRDAERYSPTAASAHTGAGSGNRPPDASRTRLSDSTTTPQRRSTSACCYRTSTRISSATQA